MHSPGGKLFVVATPIGNLEDITLRALRTLKEADCIAAEDTRHTSVLLSHYEIRKPLISYHQFNEAKRTAEFIGQLQGGTTIALVSDAGFPGVSDPGERLIAACVAAGVTVEVIPGPSAVLSALAASGLPMCPFLFEGFLPVKSGQRAKVVQALVHRRATTVFFESPYRIGKTLAELARQLPDRPVCVARELTKKFEEFNRGTAADLAASLASKNWKGEITLVVAGCQKRDAADSDDSAEKIDSESDESEE